ncbi:MAG: hypothetical protein R2705_01485 [Ilumatobacteraceae bacterium]
MTLIGSGCFLAFDDAGHNDPLELAVTSCGPPQNWRRRAGGSPSSAGLPGTVPASFANLAELGPLTPPEVHEALAAPAEPLGVHIPPETVAAIGRRTGGHPYFVQAFAAAAWDHGDGSR